MKKKLLFLALLVFALSLVLTVGASASETEDLTALKITPGRTVSVTLPEGVGNYTYNEDIVILKGFSTNEEGETTLLFACKADIPMGTYDLLYINGESSMGISVYGMGDANMDGDISARDVVLIKQAIVGMTELSGTQQVFSNVYDEDEEVNTRDAVLVLQHIVGMDVTLGTPDGDSAVCSGASLSIIDGYLYATYLDAPDTPINLGKVKGEDGIGIASIEKTSTEGLIDTYTITYTDGTTTTFTVTNGAQGIQGIQGVPGQNGHTPVITIENGNWFVDGVDTGVAAQGPKGDTGNGISSIAKTGEDGLVDTYTITYTDGTTTTFTVTNGAQGIQGIQGVPGQNGHTPVITIENGNWYVDGVDTGVAAQGPKGDTGNGISSIAKTGENGLVDTYTITYTDGTTTTFTVTNGAQGIQGIQGVPGENGHTPVITIENGNWHIDGVDTGVAAQGPKGDTGNGISSIAKTGENGLVDTYTITYTDGTTTTFTVTNGAQGIQGIQGVPGENGHTPVITIVDGNWHVDGVDTGVAAQGHKGDTGDDGLSAFEIYQKYHPEYTGTEEEWIESLKGADGAQGEQGVGIADAYVDEHYHLWLVLSNGQKIDAGYVGVSASGGTQTTYTVVFRDSDDLVLKHISGVVPGGTVQAPEAPFKEGHIFTGWDTDFSSVNENLTVTATYEKVHNQLAFRYTENGDGTVTATLVLTGYVSLYGLEANLCFATTDLSYTSLVTNSAGVMANYNGENVKISFVSPTGKNVTEVVELLSVTFTVTGDEPYATLTLANVDAFDELFANEMVTVANNVYSME